MKYTQEQLEAMSDFELNKAVAKSIGHITFKSSMEGGCDIGTEQVCRGVRFNKWVDYCNNWSDMDKWVDYCNNWSDMGTLIFDSGINLESPESIGIDDWCASNFSAVGLGSTINSYSENPLRASAIIYILIKQDE